MALGNNSGKLTFVNIKEGKLYVKPKDSEIQFFDFIEGVITKVEFVDEEYNGQKFERAKILLVDDEERYMLQIRTDSGYFRGFCNSLRMGKPTERIKIAPYYKLENDRPQTTCFIQQNGQVLKHAFTKDNPGALPQLEKIKFKGNDVWDGSKQIEFWKNWLSNINFEHEAIAGANNYSAPIASKSEADTNNITEPIDDLPF